MSEPIIADSLRHKSGVARIKKANLKVDMTPMVDLGFLLITFFIFSTELARPHEADLFMPKEGPPVSLRNSDALTVLLGKGNAVFYYHGNWKDAVADGSILKTSYSVSDGLGSVIRQKKIFLDKMNQAGNPGNGLMLVIKPGADATYQNVIDVLDEVLINGVKKYAITEPDRTETTFLASKQ